jgi:hypothetical protein
VVRYLSIELFVVKEKHVIENSSKITSHMIQRMALSILDGGSYVLILLHFLAYKIRQHWNIILVFAGFEWVNLSLCA